MIIPPVRVVPRSVVFVWRSTLAECHFRCANPIPCKNIDCSELFTDRSTREIQIGSTRTHRGARFVGRSFRPRLAIPRVSTIHSLQLYRCAVQHTFSISLFVRCSSALPRTSLPWCAKRNSFNLTSSANLRPQMARQGLRDPATGLGAGAFVFPRHFEVPLSASARVGLSPIDGKRTLR